MARATKSVTEKSVVNIFTLRDEEGGYGNRAPGVSVERRKKLGRRKEAGGSWNNQ